ncbi:MAG: hypothetical protein EXS09_02780 [Gemmataceae bacterium]|nr:hypothetical protein [Gemmataceae bacterium]
MRTHIAILILFATVAAPLFLPGLLRSELDPLLSAAPRGYVCYRAKAPPVIDGKLDEAAWADAPWSEPFEDIEGLGRPKPRYLTRMKMLWDDQTLYIAAELKEPHIWGTLKNHDAVIFHDNDFEVFLDPDCDSHDYAELELNALNTTWDLLLTKPYKDSGRAINAWEITGLKTAVHIDGTLNDPSDEDQGWTLEIAWPLQGVQEISSGKFPPKHGEQWRINFSRVEWDVEIVKGKYVKIPKRPEHNWVWSPQRVIDMHRPEKWGILQFSTDQPGQTKLLPDPAQSAREYLHSIYYAQKEHRKSNKEFLTPLSALKLLLAKELSEPKLEVTRHGYEASVELSHAGKKERWRISQDARIVKE